MLVPPRMWSAVNQSVAVITRTHIPLYLVGLGPLVGDRY